MFLPFASVNIIMSRKKLIQYILLKKRGGGGLNQAINIVIFHWKLIENIHTYYSSERCSRVEQTKILFLMPLWMYYIYIIYYTLIFHC